MKLSNSKVLYPFAVLIGTLLVYLLFAGRLNFFYLNSSYNYFNYLSEAFLKGHLFFTSTPSSLRDLTIFNGKIYMYWGPSPVLLILPFVLLFGYEVSDILYTSIIASISPMILYLILIELGNFLRIKISTHHKILLCIFFALGTFHFNLSVSGSVWLTSQVVSILYLLVSILFAIKYSNLPNLKSLMISAIFFGLAITGRQTLIFYLPILLFFVIASYSKYFFIKSIKPILIYILILIFFLILNGVYNYLRFDSFLENGYSFHQFDRHFGESFPKNKIVNLSYIPRNFHYMFLNLPSISNSFPFLSFDPEGNSILLISPLFLILINLFRKKYWHNTKLALFNGLSVVVFFSTILFLLSFWGTGWVQFGYRYFLDVIPLLLLIMAEIIVDMPLILVSILISISIIMNFFGVVWLLHLPISLF